MKKQFVLMALIVSVMMSGNLWAGSQPANAGPPFASKPANVVTVATSGGDYTTIMAALNSIADASATKPYVIKVMPGIYNESIQMKEYVDLVGSGRENTKITSSALHTVSGANNSTIENVWVDNFDYPNGGSFPDNLPAAILNDNNDNTAMKINNVKITASNNYAVGYGRAAGIKFSGGVNGVVSNSDISVSGDRDAIGIYINYVYPRLSDVTVSNCTIYVKATSESLNNSWNAGILNGYKATVRDSVITAEGARYNNVIFIYGKTTIVSSELKAIAGSNTAENELMAYRSGDGSVVTGSKLILEGNGSSKNCAVTSNIKVGASLIQGPTCNSSNVKIVNSWDENFNPIPNQ